MAHDLVKITANERVDLVDFEHLADSGFQANIRQPNAQFMTDPNGQRSWILDGFAMTNPAGKQLQVTKGRAILGQREGALIHYGALTVEGDATKTIDMATLTPTTYGVYVRFEYVDGDTGSRIFWNPAGTGEELAQTVATRRNANWSIRVELTNPGGEWLKIGEANNVGGSLVITDQRPFYFEGSPQHPYASNWSADGTGSVNDRNADRATYGVKDLQTFTAAMRQCLEDIRGRGLRRWWDRDIGGMNIGFDAAPVEDRLAVGDGDFNMFWDGTDSMLVFDASDDRLMYDRSANDYLFQIAGTTEMLLSTDGLRILNGLYVGTTGSAPTDNDIRAQGDIYSETGAFKRNDDDYYEVGPAIHSIVINGTTEVEIQTDGVRILNGLYVGSTGTAATDDEIRCDGDIHCGGRQLYFGVGSNDYIEHNDTDNDFSFWLDGAEEWTFSKSGLDGHGNTIYTTGNIGRDANDHFSFTDNDRISTIVNGVSQFQVTTDGCRVREGLRIGDDTGSIYDNDAVILGGLAVGTDVDPDADRIILGSTTFYLDWNGTDPFLNFDSNDFFQYDRSTNDLILNIGSSKPYFRWYDTSPRPVFSMESFGSDAIGAAIDQLYSHLVAPQDQPAFDGGTVKNQPCSQLEFDVGWTSDKNGFTTYKIWRFLGGDSLPGAPGGLNTRAIIAGGQTWELPFGAGGSENAPYIEFYDAQPLAGPISTGNQLELNANPISSGAVQCYGQLTFESNRSRKLEPKFYSANIYDFGDSTAYFDECYMDVYFGKNTTVQSFDCYNDLALVDAYQPVAKVSMVEKGGERRIVQEGNVETLPWPMLGPICPLDNKPFMNMNDSIFFLLGALKQLHAKHKSEVGLLRHELAALKGVDPETLVPETLPAVSSKLQLSESLSAVVKSAGADEPLTYMNTLDWVPCDTKVTPEKPVILVGSTGKHCRLTEKEARDGMWRGIIIHPSILEQFPIEESFMGDFIHPVRAYVKKLILADIPIWSGRSIRRM